MLTYKFILNTLCRKYKHPRYWLLLLTILFVKTCISFLPGSCLFHLGSCIGWLGFYVAGRRRKIAARNIQHCFPHLKPAAQAQLVKDHFRAVGLGIIETAMAWMMPKKKFDRLVKVKIVGEHYFKRAEQLKSKQGVIFLSPHLTSMELLARYFTQRLSIDLVYQKHRNPLFEEMVCAGRSSFQKLIERREIREMVKSLKAGRHLLYSSDQDFGARVSVFAPFFGIPCATARGLSWLCEKTRPWILTVSYRRLPGCFEYEFKVEESLEPIPTGDEVKDATLYNQFVEKAVRLSLPDYFWMHRRFKTRPPGEASFYEGI